MSTREKREVGRNGLPWQTNPQDQARWPIEHLGAGSEHDTHDQTEHEPDHDLQVQRPVRPESEHALGRPRARGGTAHAAGLLRRTDATKRPRCAAARAWAPAGKEALARPTGAGEDTSGSLHAAADRDGVPG